MTIPVSLQLRCAGCGVELSEDAPSPFRCPSAVITDDIDHVMTRRFPDHIDLTLALRQSLRETESANPFIRYRRMFHSYHLFRRRGGSDERWCRLVEKLDEQISAVAGKGFEVTPVKRRHKLAGELGFSAKGTLWVKDETNALGGSHKARHLMGVVLFLEADTRSALFGRSGGPRTDLAIASCGNAAIAAAILARATHRRLSVFVPQDAHPALLARLVHLRARVHRVPRDPKHPGDPTIRAFHAALGQGALPFTCQGPENGLVIEGGQTIAYELLAELTRSGQELTDVVVQVGGGALGSAVVTAFREALVARVVRTLPRFHIVQTEVVHPMVRAHRKLMAYIEEKTGLAGPDEVAEHFESEPVQACLAYARTHRSAFMWPWESVQPSVATGILDDETYDWMALVEGMLASGGLPVTVSEEELVDAHRLAREHTKIRVSPTGAAGLAGLIALRRQGVIGPDAHVAILFTGVELPPLPPA